MWTSYRIFEHLISEYLIETSDHSTMIEQAKFAYSSLRKAFEKQIKTIEDQRIKRLEALKTLKPEQNKEPESIKWIFPKNTRTNEIKNEIN